ncbi:MAG: MFS transporter [Pseudomonadota bacterium]
MIPAPSADVGRDAWKVLGILLLANILNFFDRTLPAILAEPVRLEWGLSDAQIGLVGAAFTLAHAIAGVPLGRLADRLSRRWVIGLGLLVWSVLTGVNGLVGGFIALLIVRIGIGIGEAAFAPAANSLVADLFPPARRSRAMGILMMGLPIGVILAFFTTGAITEYFGTWRAAFFIAMVPGLLVTWLILRMPEPPRGRWDDEETAGAPPSKPIRRILSIPRIWPIVFSGVAFNFATYATATFLVPNLQRYFGLSLTEAGLSTGLVIGVTGLIGLPLGGWIADRVQARFAQGRLWFGAACLAGAAVLTWQALSLPPDQPGLFIGLFAGGWLLHYGYYTAVYPTLHGLVEARLRATTMALYLALCYLLGAAFGPLIVGLLSDRLAEGARLAAGAAEMQEAFRTIGLHGSLFIVPLALGLTALALVATTVVPSSSASRHAATS